VLVEREGLASLGFRPRPEDSPVSLGYRHVVDAGFAALHVSVLVEFP
jgi:hypothetical protein